jgi:GNAT superfamily N-acetyltransferase
MSSERDWTLRYYRDGDEQGILDLLTAAFGRWPAVDIDVPPIDHLRWKLTSDPLALKSHYVAVANDGRIIGVQIIIVQHLKYGDRMLLADTCTDYAVHPDFQGRGLSREIWNFDPDYFASTFDLIISISDSPVVLHQVKTIGWGRPLANTIEWLEYTEPPPARATSTVQVATVREFDERIDEFCGAVLAPFELAIARDRSYLNWRYADSRAGRHTICIAEEGGRLVGYAVYAISRSKGFVAELLVLPDRLDVVETLAADAVRYFAEEGVSTVRCWSPQRHPYRDSLLGAGFRVLRPVGQFGFGPHGDVKIPARDDPNAPVHFTVGDTDIA